MEDYEPMDVDASGSSTSKMDISCNDIDLSIVKIEKTDDDDPPTLTENESVNLARIKNFIKQENDSQSVLTISGTPRTPRIDQKPPEKYKYTKINTFQIKLECKQKKVKKPYDLKTYGFVLSLVILLIAVIYQIIGYKCIEELDLVLIEEKLSKNLYGQVDAINDILRALKTNESSKLLVFYGGTGVGKTYATSMILENLLSSSNVYHFTMPSFADDFSTEYLFGLTVCNNTIVIVDDLSIQDTGIKYNIEDIFYKSKDLGKSMTVILVYNCDVGKGLVKKCDENFLHSLNRSLNSIKAEKYYIKFNTLTLDHLIQCIVKELAIKQIPIDEMLLAEILIHFDVTQDGCKSVYSKINFLTDG